MSPSKIWKSPDASAVVGVSPDEQDVPRDDAGIASALAELIRQLPAELEPVGSQLPLLTSLAGRRRDLARRLTVLGALIHSEADERRTAEYLLRHRADIERLRSPEGLLSAARCAAEMDVRRVRVRETPTDDASLVRNWHEAQDSAVDQPSVGDIVIRFLRGVDASHELDARVEDFVRDAITVVFELSERHRLQGGTGPALLAMRTAARRPARLVARLREMYSDPVLARRISRLLIGGDGTPIETAVLWWAAHKDLDASAIPGIVRLRWRRDLAAAAARSSSAA